MRIYKYTYIYMYIYTYIYIYMNIRKYEYVYDIYNTHSYDENKVWKIYESIFIY